MTSPASSHSTSVPATRSTYDIGRVMWAIANRLLPTKVVLDRSDGRSLFTFHDSPKLRELWLNYDRHEATGNFEDFFNASRTVRGLLNKARREGSA